IKSSVKILVPIPGSDAGNSPPLDISKDQSEDFSDSNVDSTSTDDFLLMTDQYHQVLRVMMSTP
ncbi:hypothetical protein Tco_0661637, partial [Tanacetum coccineum]